MKKEWNFSNLLNACLVMANDLAVKNGNPKVTVEHFLVALIDNAQGLGYGLLVNCDCDISGLRSELFDTFSPSSKKRVKQDKIFYSDELKMVLKEAEKIANSMFNNDFICTEHFVLASFVGNTRTSMILKKFDLDFDSCRSKLNDMIFKSTQAQSETEPALAVSGSTPSSPKKSSSAKTKTHALDTFGRNMVELAKQGKLMPVVGREVEIERVCQILGRQTKSNPVLLGHPGVGKTAIIEGLAQKMASKDVPEWLKNKQLVMLDMGSIVAGTKYRGQFEERIKAIISEVKANPNIVLVIDEIHTINGAGASEGSLDAANMFKPPLSRGEMKLIGLTTFEEYRKYIEKDKALDRRFMPVNVPPATPAHTLEILKGLRPSMEAHHNLRYADDALEAAVRFSEKYIHARHLPDKAIDIVDEAGSRLKMNLLKKPEGIVGLEADIAALDVRINSYLEAEDYETAKELYQDRKAIENQIKEIRLEWQQQIHGKTALVTKRHIAEVVGFITGVPVDKIDCNSDREKLGAINTSLNNRVIGQPEAVEAVSNALMRSLQGIKEQNKPYGSFLFLGPTGVGKTELAKEVASYMFDDPDAFMVIDMSEFAEQHEVSKFYGAPAGYVGHDDSTFFEKVRKKPHCVILLDEIEKAHPKVWNALLQILDEGRLTDSKQNVISFRNALIIMTSNLGVAALKSKSMGFALANGANVEKDHKEYKERILEAAKKAMKPEFINRLDEVVVFRKLTRENCYSIVDLILLNDNKTFLGDKNITLSFSDAVREKLVTVGFNEEYGGRELKRAFKKTIYDELSKYLINLNMDMESTKLFINADLIEDKVVFTYSTENQLQSKEFEYAEKS